MRNNRMLNFIKYQTKIIFGYNFLAALLVALIIPLAVNFPAFAEEEIRVHWAVKMNEMFYPVLGIILFSNIISQEWDWKTESLWLTKSLPRYVVMLAKVLIGVMYLIFVLAIPVIAQYLIYVQFDIPRMLLSVIPPALFLGTLGLFIGALTQNTLLGILFPIAYWIMEIATKGKYTGVMALFSRATHQLCLTDTCIQYIQGDAWVFSKMAILIGSLIFILFSGYILYRKGRKSLLAL